MRLPLVSTVPMRSPEHTDGLSFDTPPVRFSGICVELAIRAGNSVEVRDEATGAINCAVVLSDPSNDQVFAQTIDEHPSRQFRCALAYTRVRVQLLGTHVPA